MAAMYPMKNRRTFMLILKNSGIGEVGSGADFHFVPRTVPHGSGGRRGSSVRVMNSNAGKKRTAHKTKAYIRRLEGLACSSVSNFTNKPVAVLPSRIRVENCGVIKREQLASGAHGLRKAEHLTHGEGNIRRIVLKVIFGRKAVLLAKNVVDIPIGLVRVELAVGASDLRVVRLDSTFRLRRIRGG